MKNFIWILCALAFIGVFCAGCSGALAAERYAESERYTAGNFTYSAAAVRKIDLHWVNGRVDVLRGGADTLSVSESGDSLTDAQKLHWLLDGDTLYIQFCQSVYKGTIPDASKHLTLEIPEGIELEVKTVSAPVQLEEHALEHAEIETASGAISIDSLAAEEIEISSVSGSVLCGAMSAGDEIELDTTSGKISAEQLTANEIKISSVSGSVSCGELNARDEIDVTSTSGKIMVDSLRAQEAELNSVSGSVTVALAECGKMDVGTTSGAVRLTLLDGLGASIRFRSTSGSLHADHYNVSGENLVFGDGACRVRVDTTSGSLTVE